MRRDIPARAHLRQEPFFRVDGADRQGRRAAGNGALGRLHGELAIGKLQAGLEAGLQGDIGADAPFILQVQLHHLVVDLAAVLRDQRIAGAVIRRGRVVDVQRIPAAVGGRAVLFQPQARFQLVIADFLAQGGNEATALDVVFRRAHGVARVAEHLFQVLFRVVHAEQARQAGHADGAGYHARAVILVVIHLVSPGHAFGQVGVELGVGQVIGALRIAVVIAVIVAVRSRRGARRRQVIQGRLEVRVQEGARVRRARLALHVHGAVFVRLDLVRVIEEQGQLARLAAVDVFGIELVAALARIEVPGARFVVQDGKVGAAAVAEGARVIAGKRARGAVAAHRLLHAGALRGQRVAGIGFDGAAQVAGRGRRQVARARGQHDAAHVFADHGALRRQAVVVAVLLVTERHAIHGVAELLAGKAMHEQRQVLLVVAPWIGRLEADARQGLQGFQGIRAGQDFLDFILAQGDRRTRLARGNFHGGHRCVVINGRCHLGGGGRHGGGDGSLRQRRQGEACGASAQQNMKGMAAQGQRQVGGHHQPVESSVGNTSCAA